MFWRLISVILPLVTPLCTSFNATHVKRWHCCTFQSYTSPLLQSQAVETCRARSARPPRKVTLDPRIFNDEDVVNEFQSTKGGSTSRAVCKRVHVRSPKSHFAQTNEEIEGDEDSDSDSSQLSITAVNRSRTSSGKSTDNAHLTVLLLAQCKNVAAHVPTPNTNDQGTQTR